MTIMHVTYPGDTAMRFDRGYYVQHHLPLVMKCWGPLGLKSCAAFWPADAGVGTIAIAIAECRFRDEAAMRAALVSPETPRVMADVARFTDAIPVQSLEAPIPGLTCGSEQTVQQLR